MKILTKEQIENIRKNPNQQDWDYISSDNKLSEGFMKEFQYKINWEWISCNQKLSENFIIEFQDKVDWFWISGEQKLSEDFIREFKDKVDWCWISLFQELSNKFIRKNILKLNKEYLLRNENISEEIKQTIKLLL